MSSRMERELAVLIGQRIDAVRLSGERTLLEFETPSGVRRFVADGDCCSESWFNHATGVGALVGRVVRAVEAPDEERAEKEEGEPGHSGRQEVDRIYGIKLTTDAGVCEFELRNSSNGYYGGSVEALPEAQWPHYAEDAASLRPVASDF